MTVLFELAGNFHPILSLPDEARESQPGDWLIAYLLLTVTVERASPIELTGGIYL